MLSPRDQTMPTRQAYRFYYGWVIVALSFLTLFLTIGIRFSFGVFYVAILEEYGWGRGETAGAFSLALVMHALFAGVTGTLIDRFGPRILFPLGATLLAIGLAAASRITMIWQLYLFFGVIMAIGLNTLGFAPHMSLIPKWFIRKRGLAGGLALAGIGAGTMTLAPVIQVMIDHLGWRAAFLALGGIVFGVVVPTTALFHRRSPAEVGQYPDGLPPPAEKTAPPPSSLSSPGWTLRTALRTRAFWWMALVVFSLSFHTNTLVVHQAAHIVDAGYSRILAASLVGMVGLLRSIGGILGGALSDRVGREVGYTLGSGAAFVGILLFLLVQDTSAPWMLYAFVLLYGLGYGSMGPIYAATLADLFPGNSLGRILGILEIGFGLGGAVGAYTGGYLYDRLGNYTLSLQLLLVSVCLGALGIWMAGPRHRIASRSPLRRPLQ
ncbi:MAG: MFS transporter [Nitrospinota bacterium]|nr:MAG: MFS transporter [Nitrospinota bacterium]